MVWMRDKHLISSNEEARPVTLLISAYNEAMVIEQKIKNSLALDYPMDKLQIIVINDGSSDGTDKIAQRYVSRGITHHRVEGRGGKNVAINETWALVRGEIVVFSDANSLYGPDAIRRLAAWFADHRVGCVCGELQYVKATTGTAVGESLYWRYEQELKKLQSRFGEVLVVNGSIFALRRQLFQKLHPKIANDYQIPADVSLQGYAIVYDPTAVATEKVATNPDDELRRKARIVARGYEGFFAYFGHFHGLRLFMMISQKLLRWMMWLPLLVMFVANIFLLEIPFFKLTFAAQLLFYAIAAMGPLINHLKLPLIGIPYYFCMINYGAFLGLIRYISRKQSGSWEPPASAR